MRQVDVFVSRRGNAFMRDIAAWITEAAQLSGRVARLRDGGERPTRSDRTNLVVAPHEFYAIGAWRDRDIHESIRMSVPICTEQPGTAWFDVARLYVEHSPRVLDINAHGAAALGASGVVADHLRLGGVPSIDRRGSGADGAPRPVDVLFLGGNTERRAAKLAELAPILWERNADLRLFSVRRPVTGTSGGLVFGADKYDLLAGSRILLNIHRDDTTPGYFEWARMVEAMANGCAVLTEPSTGCEPLIAGEHFVESTDLAGDLLALLDDPARCREIGAAAADAVLSDHPLVATLGPILDELDDLPRAKPSWRPIAPRYSGMAGRVEKQPLLPVFQPTLELRRRIYDALVAETTFQREIDRVRSLHRFGIDDHVERVESASYAGAAPEVSVVVTLFGYSHLVTETLDSIAAATDVVLEIVLVDDHSLDDGRAVVERWIAAHPEVPMLLLGSDVNRGLPASRNLAFEHARAGLVMVMDADNLIYPIALRRLADALGENPDATFAYSSLEQFGAAPGVQSAMGWDVTWLCEGNYIDAQAMIRRSEWERLGGYRTGDPLVFGWEDWELWLRIAADGGHGVHVAQLLGRYRTQGESMLTTTHIVSDVMLAHLCELYPELPWAPWMAAERPDR